MKFRVVVKSNDGKIQRIKMSEKQATKIFAKINRLIKLREEIEILKLKIAEQEQLIRERFISIKNLINRN